MTAVPELPEPTRTITEQVSLEQAMITMRRASSILRERGKRADQQDPTALALGLKLYGEGDPELSAELLALMTPKLARHLADLLDLAASDCINIGDTSFLALAQHILDVVA